MKEFLLLCAICTVAIGTSSARAEGHSNSEEISKTNIPCKNDCEKQSQENLEWITHKSFDDFSGGVIEGGGSNAYITAKGTVEMIHRGDLNNDGYFDILAQQDHDVTENEDIFIYWGSRNGPQSILPPLREYQPLGRLLRENHEREKQVTRLPSKGGGRSILVDLNNDGLLDIIVNNFMHNYPVYTEVFIYWGMEQGYSATHRTSLPALRGSAIAAGDFDSDGFVDIAIANEGHELGEQYGFVQNLESYIYWNSAKGFDSKRRTSLPTISAVDTATGDLNNDGYPELLFVNNNSVEKSVYVYWGSGKGYSAKRRDVLTGGDPKSANLIDLNRDGKLDLVLTHGDDRAEVIIGGGDGKIFEETWVELPTLGSIESHAADLNNDGWIDLVFANSGRENSQFSYVYWGSDEGYSADNRLDLPTLNATAATTADFNSDGWPDLVFVNEHDGHTYDVNTYIYWNGPNGFDPAFRAELQGFGSVAGEVGDLNSDGHADLVLVNRSTGSVDPDTVNRSATARSPSTIFYWGNPNHHYSPASMFSIRDEHGSAGGVLCVADLNQDGVVDIAYPNSGQIYFGGSDGYGAQAPVDLSANLRGGCSVADLNQDGFLDLLFSSYSLPDGKSTGLILWGSLEGHNTTNSTALELSTDYTQAASIADLNKDGYLDLVFPDVNSAVVDFFWGDASGTYADNRHTVIKFQSASSVEIADLNADGWLDLIFGGETDVSKISKRADQILLAWGGPRGYSKNRVTRLEGYQSLEQAVADLDKDGYLDIVVSNYNSDTTRTIPVFIYWGGAEGTYSESRRSAFAAESSGQITVADYNQDTWLDIIVFNHVANGDHGIGTNIFWGSSDGYDFANRSWIQTFGVHFGDRSDLGNIYNRVLEEAYVSMPLELPESTISAQLMLSWRADTPYGTSVKFQIRGAAKRNAISTAEWRGPSDGEEYFESPELPILVEVGDRWIQYRAILATPDGGSTPSLEEVYLYQTLP